MQKTLSLSIAIAAVLLFSGISIAGQGKDNTGCGLGHTLIGAQSDDSLVLQVLQATTNGTSGNQTFGISSGTLGCEKPARFAGNERVMEFLTANMDSVARDMAMGQGEALETMAELMEVSAANRPQLYSALQSNFDQIFITGQENSATVLNRMDSIN